MRRHGSHMLSSTLSQSLILILTLLTILTGSGVAQTEETSARVHRFAASVVDLTHPLSDRIPVFPGSASLKVVQTTDDDDSYFLNRLELDEHTGTHVDAPVHFSGQRDVSQIPVAQLVCPLVVIDVRQPCRRNADYEVTVADIKAWEQQHGQLPADVLVAIRTGWEQKWDTPKAYVNEQKDDKPHFPGLSAEAAQYLAQRLIAGLAIDTLSVDPGISDDFPVHNILLAREIFHVENIAKLAAVPPTGYVAMVCPLPLKGGSGSPARILAFPASQLAAETSAGNDTESDAEAGAKHRPQVQTSTGLGGAPAARRNQDTETAARGRTTQSDIARSNE